MTPKNIAIVGYDNITSLDLSGPLEAFNSAFIEDAKGERQACYKVTIAALGAKTFYSESGLCMAATCRLNSLHHLDTLLIPGGSGMRKSATSQKLANWISRHECRIRRIASVCTGVYGMAPTGLLNGRKVTTHWRYAADLAERYPELKSKTTRCTFATGSSTPRRGSRRESISRWRSSRMISVHKWRSR